MIANIIFLLVFITVTERWTEEGQLQFVPSPKFLDLLLIFVAYNCSVVQ